MAQYNVKITADARNATQEVDKLARRIEKTTDKAKFDFNTKNLGDVTKKFADLRDNVQDSAKAAGEFYKAARNLPGVGDKLRVFENLATGTAKVAASAPQAAAGLRESAKAGNILEGSFNTATRAAGTLVGRLAEIGFATFAVREAVGVLQMAYNSFFQNTIGREIRLQETILQTQTTLASTARIFSNGRELTDPLEKVLATTGQIEQRIDNIRERSLDLAGVTSGQVIDVFNIVASQVGQIGGGLKEAEDLAIQFTAALGTFRIPLYQARQEVGSILRGDITMDSYLAKALGITNKDIQEARSKTGGIVKFLEDRLAAAVAGQAVLADSFAGVTSNIAEIGEILSQRLGRALLGPILAGLRTTFEFLKRIRGELNNVVDVVGGNIALFFTNLSEITGGSDVFADFSDNAQRTLRGLRSTLVDIFAGIDEYLLRISSALEVLTKRAATAFTQVGGALGKLALAFGELQLGVLESLLDILVALSAPVAALAEGFAGLLNVYAEVLKLPGAQVFAQLSAQFKVLELAGVTALTRNILLITTFPVLIRKVFLGIKVFLTKVIQGLRALFLQLGVALKKLGANFAALGASIGKIGPQFQALQVQLERTAASLNKTAAAAATASGNLKRGGLNAQNFSNKLKAGLKEFVGFNLKLIAIQAAIVLALQAWGKFQQEAEDNRALERAENAVARLNGELRDVARTGDGANSVLKRAFDAQVQEGIRRTEERIVSLTEKLEKLENRPSGSGRNARGRSSLLGRVRAELDEAEKRLAKLQSEADRANQQREAEEDIQSLARERKQLEEQIRKLRKDTQKQLNDLQFRGEQRNARIRIQLLRREGELRIRQQARANRKLLEGVDGGARAALEALNAYLESKDRGELDIEAQKRELQIEAADYDKQIADYRYNLEEKILQFRKRAGMIAVETAKAVKAIENTGPPGGGGVGSPTGGALGEFLARIRSAEGGYTSINRGVAGDTPGGMPGLTNMSIADIMAKQRAGEMFAVGAYQFIPGTLQGAVSRSGIDPSTKFSPAVQDQLATELVLGGWKRPGLTDYLTGKSNNLNNAQNEAALEWAGLHKVGGGTAYPGQGGNAASATVRDLLPRLRAEVMAGNATAGTGGTTGGGGGGSAQSVEQIEKEYKQKLESMMPDVEANAAALKALNDETMRLKQRMTELRQALEKAKSAEQFERILDSMDPEIWKDVQQQQREQLVAVDAFQQIAAIPATDQSALRSQSILKSAALQRQTILDQQKEFLERLKESNATAEEKQKLEEKLNKLTKKGLEDLRKATNLRVGTTEIERDTNELIRLKNDLSRAQLQNEQNLIDAQKRLAGLSATNPLQRRVLETEADIRSRRAALFSEGKPAPEVLEQFDKFAEQLRENGNALGAFETEIERVSEIMSIASDLAGTVVSAQKRFITSLASGGDFSQGIQELTRAVGDKFLSAALDYIYKPIQENLGKNFAKILGIEDPFEEAEDRTNTLLEAQIQADANHTNKIVQAISGATAEATESSNAAANTINNTTNTIRNSIGNLATAAVSAAQIAGGASQAGQSGTFNTLSGLSSIFGGVSALTGVFSNGFKLFAKGGFVNKPTAALLGEGGEPEYVIPASKMAEALGRFGSGARGTSVVPQFESGSSTTNTTNISNSGTRTALERQIATQTFVRPTTTMGRESTIRFESSVINGVEYVTREEAERIGLRSARQGRELALGALQNSPRARKRAGI